MDRRVFRMAILTIISAFILVLVIVYATNTDKINKLFGWGTSKVSTPEEPVTEVSVPETVYGEQIGDNLSAFTMDDDFFDPTEEIPAVVVIQKSATSADTGASDASIGDSSDETTGTGMAIVGELENPNALPPVDEAGYLTTVPQAPPGGFGEYIPGDNVVGTP